MGLKKPRGNNAPSRVATADELKSFTPDEDKQGYREIPYPCGKCGGSGRYWGPGGLCFGCDGRGQVIGRLYTPEKREELDAAAEKRAQQKEAKREKKRMSVLKESLRTYPEAHKISAEILDRVDADGLDNAVRKYGEFIIDVATKGAAWGFTDKQATTLVSAYKKRLDMLDKREAQAEKMIAAPDGRQTITGKVVHATIRETQYGVTWKMIVLDDRMFKVWSTVPKAVIDEVSSIGDLEGARVTYTGTLKVSRDDESFAFASRPGKARLLDTADAA